MRKHFDVKIAEGCLEYERKGESVRQEEKLDGIYVLRTSESPRVLNAPEVVRTYKSLSHVEDAFRCIKGIDLSIRPIRHHLEPRVRAHVFICLLSYYVEWNMRKALASVLYEEEVKIEREEPVEPVKASAGVKRKKSRGKTEEGWPVYDWKSLMTELGTCCRNTCEVLAGKFKGQFTMDTEHTTFQKHVFELLGLK